MHTGTAANGSSSTVLMDTSTLLTVVTVVVSACGPLEDYIMKDSLLTALGITLAILLVVYTVVKALV